MDITKITVRRKGKESLSWHPSNYFDVDLNAYDSTLLRDICEYTTTVVSLIDGAQTVLTVEMTPTELNEIMNWKDAYETAERNRRKQP